MKKTTRWITSLLVLCAVAAFAAPTMTNAVIAKILMVKAKEFFANPENSASLLKSQGYEAELRFGKPEFEDRYYCGREAVFDSVFGGYKATVTSGESFHDDDEGWYSVLRKITINQFKEQIHQGDTMMEIYVANRTEIKKMFAEMSKSQRDGVKTVLSNLKQAFNEARDGKLQTEFGAYVTSKLRYDYDVSLDTETWKERNVLKSVFKDLKAGTFALRRFKEGGNQLVRKYEKLLFLVDEDLG